MSAIGPGDYVEALLSAGALVVGRIYRVSHFSEAGDCDLCGDFGPCIEIEGDPEDDETGHCHCYLRPVYRPSADLIETLKQPAPDSVRELEEA